VTADAGNLRQRTLKRGAYGGALRLAQIGARGEEDDVNDHRPGFFLRNFVP
jgi:hypothetical protein